MLKVHFKNLGAATVLCLRGRLVSGETEILRNAVNSLPDVSPETGKVALDLARVTTVDAAGLGVMLELRERFDKKGIRFELMNVTSLVSRVLRITRLDSVFQITSGVEFFPGISRSGRVPVTQLASCA